MIKNQWIKDFPQIKNGNVYLDTAATSLKPLAVINTVNHYYKNLSSNIHRGMYEAAIETTEKYEETRETVAKFINSKVDEVIYTRGTTSALNLVAYAYGFNNLKPGDEIIVSELEHHSSFLPWQYVAKKTGAILKFIELNQEGRITTEAFKKVISNKTKVVALTYVSNVMGYITPMKEIIDIAHIYDAIVVVDAAQAIQHLAIDVVDLDCDFLAFSGHKMLGPTGIGILYGKERLLKQMEPFQYGGDMNEDVEKVESTWKRGPQKFEAGTMPIASVLGLKTAIDYIENIGVENIHNYITNIHRYALEKLSKIDGLTVYNKTSETGIISFNLDHIPSHDAITYFAQNKIAIRAGQHCAKLICDWLGIYSCLRASIYIYNTENDIDKFVETIKEAIAYFKELGF
ncbi:aminotransferase class V-fold PLP-dependent enzyme [Candidatus Izemoplasma sp. B36]|uniref:aminotransferase class V-fold PLP-dependent enzyme n=1 Tax=Candidatus Izemoplasma sp. B36 TaxID=3242468 RepID=UPI0035568061